MSDVPAAAPAGAAPAAADAAASAAPAAAAAAAAAAPAAAAPAAAAAAAAPAAPAAAAPASGAAAPAAPAATLADGGVVDPKAPAAAATAVWPENWRDQLAEQLRPGDKKFRTRLDRFSAITDIGKSWLGLEDRVSSGELKAQATPPANATDEQMTAWRKEQGLPVSAADYVANLKLGEGVVPGEADKPLLEAVGKMALEKGYSQDVVNSFVGFQYALQDSLQTQRNALDVQQRDETVAQLSREMGPDFQRSRNLLNVFWSNYPADVKASVLGARTDDGRIVGDMPGVVTFFANLARELNPAAAVLPPGSPSDIKGVASRKTEIEGLMYKDSPMAGRWGPHYTPAIQEEYRQLIDAETTMKARTR